MKRPLTLAYWLDERPPLAITLLSGLQHVGLASIFLLVPVIACRAAGLPPEQTLDVMSLSMIVMALGVVLQAFGPRGSGSGFLCPSIFSAGYLPASLLAVKTGGASLMFGMTVFAGVVEIVFSRLLRPLRPLFPPEIAGFVVAMIGVVVGTLGFRVMAGTMAEEGLEPRVLGVFVLTLGTMVGLNVWTRGATKIFCALIGMAVGYAASAAVGILPAADLMRLAAAPLFNVPGFGHLAWTFDAALAVPFAVAALAATLRAMGDITICQRSNDADWVRPDLGTISAGAMANGFATLAAGLAGSVGCNTSTSNVGLAAATGVTSRLVAWGAALVLVVAAFLPKAGTLFAIMPAPVVGATLVFAAALVFVNGLLIVTSRVLDARRTFVIGVSFMLGIAVDVVPALFAGLPAWVHPFVSSSLVLGTLSALLLNLVFRAGVRRTQTLIVAPHAVDAQAIEAFVVTAGGSWGARRDVVERARFNLAQSVETIVASGVAAGPLEITAAFDEFRLDLRVSYDGAPLELPQARPTNEEILDTEHGERRLAGYMLRRFADRVSATEKGGRATILFHFDH